MKLIDILKEFMMSDIEGGADSIRVKRTRGIQVEYNKTDKRRKAVVFDVKDTRGSGKKHKVVVQFPDYSQISRQKKNITREEKVKMALTAGDLKVFCSCPDFRYKGFKYIADQMDYGIEKEKRPPDIMNPDREGTSCKHVLGVFNHINGFIDKISNDMKWEKKK